MVNVLRRFSKPIMLVITVLVIVSFTTWGPNIMPGSGGGAVAHLYGKPVSLDEYKRQERKVRVYYKLGASFSQALDARMTGVDPVYMAMIFEHEADALGITATENYRDSMLSTLPAFFDEKGQPSPQKFDDFVKNVLNPEGYSKDQISEFLAGEARFRRVQDLVGSTSGVTSHFLRSYARRTQTKVEASYVLLKRADFLKDVTVTDEDVKKEFKEKEGQLKTPAQRKVKYAAFLLPPQPEGKTMEEAKRVEALQLLANKAYDFREALEAKGANFDELAKQFGATVSKTPEFFGEANPPKELEGSAVAGREAFKLTKEKPYSKHLTMEDQFEKGAYVLAYEEEKPAEPKTFESVKEQLQADLRESRAGEAVSKKAAELKTKIEEAKKGGKTFYEAVEALGQKAVPFPVFGGSSRPPQGASFFREVLTAVQKLAPGDISEPVVASDSTTTLLIHLDQRTAGDEEAFNKAVENGRDMLDNHMKDVAFREWLVSRSRAAGLTEAGR